MTIDPHVSLYNRPAYSRFWPNPSCKPANPSGTPEDPPQPWRTRPALQAPPQPCLTRPEPGRPAEARRAAAGGHWGGALPRHATGRASGDVRPRRQRPRGGCGHRACRGSELQQRRRGYGGRASGARGCQGAARGRRRRGHGRGDGRGAAVLRHVRLLGARPCRRARDSPACASPLSALLADGPPRMVRPRRQPWDQLMRDILFKAPTFT